ncbi:phospholipid-translocating P-type ATPase, flippase [Nitzschia inconspicua]|uniref:DNA helicase n=1 Tax=Nitzschia inconspicua TaxID=303405 RepID=A0A9K3M5A5_9STRA|nr:phospholipid-translocating P-type ATPase, flippase [Nitzschia inconspicua]
MSDQDEPISARKRRRIAAHDDDDDDDDDDDNDENHESDDNEEMVEDSAADRRRRRVEALAAERRRQRLQRELAELHDGDADLTQPPSPAGVGRNSAHNDDDDNVDDDDDDLDHDYDYEDNEHPDGDAYDPEEEEEEGEDLMENAERDYQRIEALDTYGREGIDDRDYEAMDIDQRRAAEAEIRARERQAGRGGRDAGIYGMALDDMEADEDEEARRARRGMFRREKEGDVEDDQSEQDQEDDQSEDDIEEEDLDKEDPINLEAFDVPLKEWLTRAVTMREVQRRFRAFLRHFRPETAGEDSHRRRRANGIYEQKIRNMCASNLESLQVSYDHLMEAEPLLAVWLADAPWDMLQLLDRAATNHTLMLFPSYKEIKQDVHVRISDIPIMDSLRDLRRTHLEHLVKVHGVVTRRGGVYPLLLYPVYTCVNRQCGAVIYPEHDIKERVGKDSGKIWGPEACPRCEGSHFKLDNTKSVYGNVQRVNLQESPGSVPPGRVPRQKEVFLTEDLIDTVRPGEEIEVTGIFQQQQDFSLTLKSGFPVFSTNLLANHIRKREDASSASNMSEVDVRKILELSRDPKIGDRIVQSMAPSIFGHDNCKMALAMSLFGGVPKNINDKHRIRGDVNVLLLGDPGTAKSQLLKYAEATAPRAVYSTGKGASAVGLTAGVHKDPVTKEWTLEGGALVLADKGVALIDEFDKMNEQDRTSIHEAMEQQSISVSKAGIVTSLQARCSVIAAANPIGGRYDSSNTLADNVELTDPILQRFDILCVLQDTVDPVQDERLASFVTSSHMNAIPTRDLNNGLAVLPPSNSAAHGPGIIDQELLRKYIQYARTNVKPDLRGNAFDQEKVASLYVALRRESANSGGVPIAVRHIESIMRMAEAHAKMHLRDYVRDDDMDAAIKMMLESFIVAQKFSVRRSLRRSFAKYITSGEDRAHLLLHILGDLMRKEMMYQKISLRRRNLPEDDLVLEVPLDELESRARERRIYDVLEFCKGPTFNEAGYVLDENRGLVCRSAEVS